MPQSNDATPAYRGYRLQALYALFRILDQEGNNNLVFLPEVKEDLSIKNERGDLLEVIQVKSGRLIGLSDFKSFFQRIYPLIKRQKIPQIIIVSYGEVRPELRQAIECDGPKREQVAKKIKKMCSEIIPSDEEARIVLENLKLDFRDESEVTEKVYSRLRKAFTGIDPNNAFDNLSYWLYVCSENKLSISKSDVIKKLENIGKFVNERDAHHEEWFKSINPIDDREINQDELERLRKDFYQGVSAKYAHILADTDVLRSNKIKDIKTKFSESSVVIIHGASGQGKTTLAYRYLHEHFPNMWRFKIELVQDRKHAFNIARAIMGHADAIGFPVAVYMDVSAKDKDWPDLINQLSSNRNIKILVTIREEDYKRAIIQPAFGRST
jgi:ABC-type multidrug transport system fused ATPase/permease subunit